MSGFRLDGKAVLLMGVAFILIASSNAVASPKFSGWSTPMNLGPTVNSALADSSPAVSKDALSLFITTNRPGGFGQMDIWVSQRPSVNDPWGPPINLGASFNTAAIEGAPAFSRDGHWMFFNSNRPGGFGLNDLWVSYRQHIHDDFDWQAPVNLGSGVNTAFTDQGASYLENDESGTPLLFFASNRPGGIGESDIYVSTQLLDGSFGPAVLVAELSSSAGDLRPVITFDGLEMFLFSDRPGGFGGSDIWVSTRDSVSDSWTAPVNLGPIVNGPQDDIQAYIASDRQTLYFVSDRPGGVGGRDLFVTTREHA